jgi:hypothetical protein
MPPTLTLDDVDWRASEILVRAKGRQLGFSAPGAPAFQGNRSQHRHPGQLALLWQNLAIDWRNWIPESDFQ